MKSSPAPAGSPVARVARRLDGLYVETFLRTLRTAAIGTLMIVLVGYPLAYWIARYAPANRRGVFLALAALTLLVALIILAVVPEHKHGHNRESFRAQLQGIGKVFTSSLFWRAAPLTVSAQASFLVIQSLRAGPRLRDVAAAVSDCVPFHVASP